VAAAVAAMRAVETQAVEVEALVGFLRKYFPLRSALAMP
jgi:hypothetical protein